MRRRVRSVAYRTRRTARRLAKANRKRLRALESSFMKAMFGAGGEPSWDDIIQGARSKLLGAQITGSVKDLGKFGSTRKAIEKIWKPKEP